MTPRARACQSSYEPSVVLKIWCNLGKVWWLKYTRKIVSRNFQIFSCRNSDEMMKVFRGRRNRHLRDKGLNVWQEWGLWQVLAKDSIGKRRGWGLNKPNGTYKENFNFVGIQKLNWQPNKCRVAFKTINLFLYKLPRLISDFKWTTIKFYLKRRE